MNHSRSPLRAVDLSEVESSNSPVDHPRGRSTPDRSDGPRSSNSTRPPSVAPLINDAGQATAEYALVMLAAVTLAGLLIAWAASTDGVGRVMDAVIDSLLGSVP